MGNYRRANRKRAYYDSMSDSRTPMSQSELAAEAEAVFEIVFDEDPNALSQSGAIGKIFDHFRRYGISNDYSDAVDMIIYIEENLLRRSHRANRKRVGASVRWESSGMSYVSENYTVHNMGGGVYGEPDQWVILENDYDVPEISGVFDTVEDAMNAVEQKTSHTSSRRVANADHAEAVDFVFSSFDKDMEEFSWWYYNDYDGLYANVEKILSRGFTGGPFDIDKIIVDVVNGESRFFKRRANRKRAYYDDYLESGGAFNYENPNYEYYTDREIEEGLRPQEFDGWANEDTQLANSVMNDFSVYLDVSKIAWTGTPDDIANYYRNNITPNGYDLNRVDWAEIWEAMREDS